MERRNGWTEGGTPNWRVTLMVPRRPAPSLPYREQARRLEVELGRLGVRASTKAVDSTATPSLAPANRVAVLLAPGLAGPWVRSGTLTVAWAEDDLEGWLADPALENVDLIFATTKELAESLRARTSRLIRTLGADDAAGLRDALDVWRAQPSVAIQIAPLTWKAAASWGDTAFGRALQKEFELRGWRATLHVAKQSDAPRALAADLALHLHGLRQPAVRPGQTSILWVISHPDLLTDETCEQYDLIFVASKVYAEQLARRLRRPVRVLEQATDPERFHPDPTGPRHAVLFVGGSRGEGPRPMLDALAGAGHGLAVYGGHWTPDRLADGELRGAWIPNHELRRYYASADIVLNDQWPDMREQGFVSNRTFDVFASGGFVISENVPGMHELFDGAVVTFNDAATLPQIVDYYANHPEERRERAERGRAAVLARHTFRHRVDAILAAVEDIQPSLARAGTRLAAE